MANIIIYPQGNVGITSPQVVFNGTNCATLTCVGGIDDAGPACATTSASFSWTSVVGQNYYILVHGY